MSQKVSKHAGKLHQTQIVDNPKEDDKTELIPMTLPLARNVLAAAAKYRKAYGLASDQDVVRIATARFLSQEGFLTV